MPLLSSTFTVLDDIASRFAAESIFATALSDEGLIPAYSLLGDLLGHLGDQPELAGPVKGMHVCLDTLLNEARPYDEASITHLKALAAWLPAALVAVRDGNTPAPLAGGNTAPAAAVAAPVAVVAVEVDQILVFDLGENRELLGEFHSEGLDHLDQIEAALLALDAAPNDRDALNGLFRSFHTIKGVSGFLHLTPMHKLTHEVESLLDLARTDKLQLTPAIITEILNSRDAIQEMMGQITLALERGQLPNKAVPVAHLIAAVRRLAVGDASKPSAAQAPVQAAPQAAPAADSSSAPAAVSSSPDVPAAAAPAAAAEAGRPAATTSSSSVRVNTEKLDSLVDVVGELVIVQSQLMESAKGLDAGGTSLARNLAQFGRITKELQHTAMSLRMVPIKPTFQRMERLVRDLSRDFGKQVLFETRGDETEIDRTVAEEIVDPLVHMVRNSLDHGLEGPADRKAAGKNEQGRLRLAAYHEGSNLVIELIDDGRGINKTRVLEKARSQGLVAEGITPPTDVILNMIFLPGFSTAAKVTAVSGRGVGMDVVRRNIERLRGQIQIETVEGQGTTFRIRLPLTTAIIDGLLVRVGEDRFILPTITVQVALKPTKEMLTTIQGRGEVIDHRGKILPLHRLHRRFEIEGAEEDPTKGIVVMIEVGSKVYALLVDELLNKQEVVIKNLGAFLQDRPGVAGGAILGDGTIALILDPASLCAA
ncbi:MAG: chemotaxis protein CheA [Opitutus sp.]|nr:chemotaxis protein CheA [Opitutus sp.]MCS6247875.1 chemotaxis protein CheA [Opitutus sp.]MCS6275089.1 chemotaxis protein CheA [Opitutus sp.]MCS6276295.1 chemotaxis protein CheA [Opitutus sp.]MCS6301389.1 chemotaxis protein CheA [Opitutus sp.]